MHLSRLVASVALLTDDPETVFVLDVGTNDFDHADSNDEIVWEGSRDRALVTADASDLELPMDLEEGTPPDVLPHARATVPCAPFELATLSTSEVFVTLEDQPEVAVGHRTSLRPTCTEGSTTVSIRVHPRNARDTRILFRATTSDSTPAAPHCESVDCQALVSTTRP